MFNIKSKFKGLVFISALCLLFQLGTGMTVQAASSVAPQASEETGEDINNDIELFNDGVVHSIQISISDEDYQEMISIYQETGEKEYFKADVVIDGVTIQDVGIRLKGNSTLRTALGGKNGGGGPGGQAGPPFDVPQGRPAMPEGEVDPNRPAGQPPVNTDGASEREENNKENLPQKDGADIAATASDDGVKKIPLMIKFDKYVDDQTYQGYSLLAIRTGGHASDASLLQEPVTNDMVRLIGLPATQTAFAGVKLNDEEEQFFTLSEVINEDYIEKYFENTGGILYKSEMGASLSYNGEDAENYISVYDQKTDEDNINMEPVIEFTRFLDEADDAAFEDELDTYLDVESFASYLAINNLLVNLDTIAGMNNNYYLYYDDETERFTLLMWDSNESLGGMSEGGNAASYDLYATKQASQKVQEDRQGQETQEDRAGRPGGGPGGGPMGGQENVLVSRFMASEQFKALYEEKLQEVYREVYLSGELAGQVEEYAALMEQELETRELVDAEAYEQAVQDVLDFISERSDYLASTSLLGTQSGVADQ